MATIGERAAHEWAAAGPGHRFARRLAAALLIVSILPGAALTATLDVKISSMRSHKGMLRLCLTADRANFPDCKDDAHAITRSVNADTGTIVIEGLTPGTYALSLIHDENGNARLDTLAGIPREGFGFSRNPVILFGPPRFSAARFTLESGVNEQDVRMRYLL